MKDVQIRPLSSRQIIGHQRHQIFVADVGIDCPERLIGAVKLGHWSPKEMTGNVRADDEPLSGSFRYLQCVLQISVTDLPCA